MSFESHTFGGTEAAKVLAKELNARHSPKLSARVCKYVQDFAFHLNQLEKTDSKTKRSCARLLYTQVMESVTDRWEWDGNIRTLLKNVLHSLYMKHVCWEVQLAGKCEKNFGKCLVCRAPAIIKLRVHNAVKGRYCETHQYHIKNLHKTMRTSGAE